MTRLAHAVERPVLRCRIVQRFLRLFFGITAFAGWIAACSSETKRSPIYEASGGGAAGQAGESGAAGTPDGGGIVLDGGLDFDTSCGYQEVNAKQEPGRVYFVIDRSGSMSEIVGSLSKYSAVRSAIVKLVQQIGWRSEIGATLFPSASGGACAAGSEVYALAKGDPKSYLDEGKQGPLTKKFAQAINTAPKGGTPTGATLQELVPKLKGLGPNTYVILATDGGPNCNGSVSCSAAECIPNIEKMEGCSAPVNCCDPSANINYSNTNCLDSETPLSAVLALAQAGVKTIVIGMPGSAEYATLLDLMAVAGGAPREGDTRYYRVDDLSALEQLLLKIGGEVTVSCDITLSEAPENRNEVNVFLDQNLLPYDPENGWDWTGDATLALRGKACEDLAAGAFELVRVVEGCPTEVK